MIIYQRYLYNTYMYCMCFISNIMVFCAQVKIELPEVSASPCDGDISVRFEGAFVMYNYARVANILNRHRIAVEQGTCTVLTLCM